MNLEGTKTQANLMAAFAGESEARNKYTYYASKAKKDGFVQISQLFTETANNEKEHAKIWFKLLHNGSVPDTATNLQDAATGENTSGRRCIPSLPVRHGRRALRRLPACLRLWLRSSRSTSSGI